MKQFFKNKFFYIVTVVTLLVTIVPSVLYSMGISFAPRNLVCMILTPMQKAFNYAAEGFDGIAAYFYKFDELKEENEMLKERVSELEAQIYDAAELEEMYNWQSEFLELKRRRTDFKFLAASVTGRESGNYSRVLTLDVGTGAGVEIGMPVITAEGIVGQVTEVGYNWSKVTTIVEANSAVGAYVERTKAAGVCEGDFSLSSEGKCTLSYLPADSAVITGDRIVSTGYGSVYPRGLTIGYVSDVGINPYNRSLDVSVQCSVDFSTLTHVMIITSFDETSENAW